MLEVSIKKWLPGFTLDVSFTVDKEILSFVGPSGCGKSLTLQCISGLITPDEGYVRLNGRTLYDSSLHVNLPPRRRRIGYVFQNYALFPHMTVRENVAFGIRNLPSKDINDRVFELLRKMRLSEFANHLPGQLSGGQQQRVALARALAPGPEVLLLDEPFSALDTQVRGRLERELQAIHQFFKGDVIFVTHNLAEAYRLGSRIAVYESGRILQLGNKRDIIERPVNRTVARLTGVKNLFDGQVTGLSDSTALVAVPEVNGELRLVLRGRSNIQSGRTVAVGIRPEYIRMADGGAGNVTGDNAILGIVTEVVDGVSTLVYRVRVEGGSEEEYHFEVETSKLTAPRFGVGDRCCLHLPPDRLFVTSIDDS